MEISIKSNETNVQKNDDHDNKDEIIKQSLVQQVMILI